MQVFVVLILSISTLVIKGADGLKIEDTYLMTAIADTLSVGIMFLIVKMRSKPLAEYADIKRTRILPIIMALLGGFALSGITSLFMAVLTSDSAFNDLMKSYNAQFASLDIKSNLLLYASTIWLIIPICEELVFRGFLFREIKRIVNWKYAIVIQAALFGIIHFNPIQSSYTFVIALFFGYAYQKTGKIAIPILMHILFNIMGTSLGFLSDENAAMAVTLAGIPLFIVSFTYFARMKSRTDNIETENETENEGG
jgi:membrane protease YdiL (CAAX protease family)